MGGHAKANHEGWGKGHYPADEAHGVALGLAAHGEAVLLFDARHGGRHDADGDVGGGDDGGHFVSS